jgi:RNA polymerase sigma-70 factor, ECF subfamily
MERYRPALERFLHSRLPPRVRRLEDTQDAVQEVLLRAHRTLERFEYRGVGSFWAYLRTIARNYALHAGEKRAAGDRSLPEDSFLAPVAPDLAPLLALVGREQVEAFERALTVLPEPTREALLMRLELGLGYAEIAAESGYPSADAARMAIARALERVGREMGSAESRA